MDSSGPDPKPRVSEATPTPTNYRRGWLLVLGVILLSSLICAGTVRSRPESAQPRAAQALEQNPLALGSFLFQERSGQTVTQDDLADRVWIGAFIFTRCPSSCPRISSTMKGIQAKLEGTGVRLVSISVDPKHDTPDVLERYASGLGADPERWWFLTGDHESTFALIQNGFRLPVEDASPEQVAQGLEEVAHSSKLALVDRGNRVVGYFASDDPAEVQALTQAAHRLENVWAVRLPILNATLNGSCALLLLLGWSFIRAGRQRAHAACMITALVVSAVFLGSYLTYHFLVVRGSVPFQGVGRPIRLLYFSILISHTVLAIALVPLVLLTVRRAWTRKFALHARLAQITFPIWLYVSITGVVVYWMLYRLDFSTIALAAS